MSVNTDVRIPVDILERRYLSGKLRIMNTTRGLVIFAHGSGSGSHGFRNQYLSQVLNNDGFSTLLVDLLTVEENDSDLQIEKILNELPGVTLNKFKIELLCNRLATITRWVLNNFETKDLKMGFFGASTGAAAAFVTASQEEFRDRISAIVTRSGRPDLVFGSLSSVKSASLLIVGKNDVKSIIQANEKALKKICGVQKKVIKICGATHLFEEKGTLEQVGTLSADWFRRYL